MRILVRLIGSIVVRCIQHMSAIQIIDLLVLSGPYKIPAYEHTLHSSVTSILGLCQGASIHHGEYLSTACTPAGAQLG